jgi:hypothetical protein
MKPFTRQTALDCSRLHPDKVMRYFHDGVIVFLPDIRWEKWMQLKHPHEGRKVEGGWVVRTINPKKYE